MLLNTYFHFGFSLAPKAVSAADLERIVTSPISRKIAIFLHECFRSGAPKKEAEKLFSETGIRDLLSPNSLPPVLDRVFSVNLDEAATLQKAMDDQEFAGLVKLYFD